MQFLHRKCVCVFFCLFLHCTRSAALTVIRYVQIFLTFIKLFSRFFFLFVSGVRTCVSFNKFRKTNAFMQRRGDRKNWLMYASLNWRSMYHKPTHMSNFITIFLFRTFFFGHINAENLQASATFSWLDEDHRQLKSNYKFRKFMVHYSLFEHCLLFFFIAFGTSSIAFIQYWSGSALCNTLRKCNEMICTGFQQI